MRYLSHNNTCLPIHGAAQDAVGQVDAASMDAPPPTVRQPPAVPQRLNAEVIPAPPPNMGQPYPDPVLHALHAPLHFQVQPVGSSFGPRPVQQVSFCSHLFISY